MTNTDELLSEAEAVAMQEPSAELDCTPAADPWALVSLTIADCAPLYEKLKNLLNAGETVLLNISDCQDIDTAGLQFLAAIQNDPEVSLRVRWTKPSEPVSLKASRLGLTSWIEAGAVEA